jgi:hypothetical protein
MKTSDTKPRPKRARKPKLTTPVPLEDTPFFLKALTPSGRFILAGLLLRAACSVLIRGRALI